MKFIVTAQAFNAKDGKPIGKVRIEEIDIKTNELFKNAKTIKQVHDTYEYF